LRKNKGSRNPMWGKKHSKYSKNLMAEAVRKRLLGKFGEEAMAFKGENAHFNTKHSWLKRHFDFGDKCKVCGAKDNLELANINGTYNRDYTNYLYLCRRCHRRWDMGLVALDINGKVWKREFIGKRLIDSRKIATKRINEYGTVRFVAKANYDHERIEKSFPDKESAETWYKNKVREFSLRKVPVICIQQS
jgi:hypothetical protein